MNPFDQFITDKKLNFSTSIFTESTHTAQQAADALQCDVGQIAKSIVFYIVETNKPIVVVASGRNRVSKEKLTEIVGSKVKTAGPEFVLEHTGFNPGSVPPFGHKNKIKTFIDEDLQQYEYMYAAPGKSDGVFKLTIQELIELSEGEVIDVKE